MLKSGITLLLVMLCGLFSHAQSVTCSQRFVFVGDLHVGATSTRKLTVNYSSSTNDVRLITAAPFLLSLDSISFNSNIILPAAQTGQAKNLFIRLLPSVKDSIYKSEVKFIYNAIDTLPKTISLIGSSFNADSFYKVMSWNMLWFGSGSCNCDTTIQRIGAEFVINEIHPSLAALQEVTWPNHFRLLASHIGQPYIHRLATYCSQAKDTLDANWDNSQKTAYLIDTSLFNALPDHGFASSNFANTTSVSEYWAFASGRVPQVLPLIDKTFADTTWYFNIHAKALSDLASYQRRQNGAFYLADSLNQYYKQRKTCLVGDYNDFLEGSILSGYSTPYKYLLDNAMTGISMPADYPGVQTYAFGSGIIDNLCINEKMLPRYAPKSYTVLSELSTAIDSYATTVSDHYPILFYVKRAAEPAMPASINTETAFNKYQILQSANGLEVNCGGTCQEFMLQVYNMQGAVVSLRNSNNAVALMSTQQWPNGMYNIRIVDKYERAHNYKILIAD
jgi:hypothetical protein